MFVYTIWRELFCFETCIGVEWTYACALAMDFNEKWQQLCPLTTSDDGEILKTFFWSIIEIEIFFYQLRVWWFFAPGLYDLCMRRLYYARSFSFSEFSGGNTGKFFMKLAWFLLFDSYWKRENITRRIDFDGESQWRNFSRNSLKEIKEN